MIQSVVRAFKILEAIRDLEKDNGIGLVEVAKVLELEKSTTYNLIKTLLALGYVEQENLGGKYKLGHKLLELTRNGLGDEYLKELCDPFCAELSEKVGENVSLVAYRSGNLKIICRHLCENELVVAPNNFKPLYTTVSGRCLLAQLSDSEVKTIVEILGLPEDLWDEIYSFDDLLKELREIRENGQLIFKSEKRRLGGIGIIVPSSEKYAPLAIGSAMPLYRFKEKKKVLCKFFAEYSNNISKAISW